MPTTDVKIPSGAMLIGGEWDDSGEGRRVNLNPASGEPLGSFVLGDVPAIDRAVESAVEAFPAWRDLAPASRRDMLLELGRLVQAHDVEFGLLRTLELGAPLKRKRGRSMAAEFIVYYAGWVDKLEGRT